ncbi:7289_t:CDS:2 [Cetraspora pellucida]|uniref:7289_t:CDS:1 n=1 Tax=Cetraspora pellucida TaxID=1433469 RepID=A0ACA9PDR8_9GLOM|nr:7289_t:CDS:2 [Cetraspora pellucida]
MHIVGTLSFEDFNPVTVGFEGLNFLIRTEPLPLTPNADIHDNRFYQANISFMDGDLVEICDIPKHIKCKDITNNIYLPPLFNRGFNINLASNYDIEYYDKKIYGLQRRKTIKAVETLDKWFRKNNDDDDNTIV